MGEQANRQLTERFFAGLINGQILSLADQLLAPTFRFHCPGMQPNPGPHPPRYHLSGLTGAGGGHDCPRGAGCRSLAYERHPAGQDGCDPAHPHRIHLTGMNLFQITDHQITAIWVTFDSFSLMQQLGVIPSGWPRPA